MIANQKVEELESTRESETEECSALRREADQLSSRLEILEKEKCTMAETMSRQDEQLRAEEEKCNQEIAVELTMLREKVGKLEEENLSKTNSLAEFSNTLESIRSRFRTLVAQKNDLDEKLVGSNTEMTRYREMADEREKDLITANDERELFKRGLMTQSQQLDIEKDSRQKEVKGLQETSSNLEGINETLRESVEDAKRTIQELEKGCNAHSALQEEMQRTQMQCDEKERHILQLEDEIDSLREDLVGNEESMLELKKELHQLKDDDITTENDIRALRSDPPEMEGVMSDHLSFVKDAFHKQAAVLEDVKLSEIVLENLIDEVMNLATQSESEMLELSSTLGTVDDLLLHPSSLLASLDLAGLDSSEYYFGEVRSRLEDMAALAYNTSVELKNRQNQLVQWQSNRTESPSIPITPPCSKQLKRALFNMSDAESSNNITAAPTPTVTDGAKELRDKVASARLLCCVLENRNKMELASAFRKWTCAAGVINASSSHKETAHVAAELAHELEITRDKLMILKTHLKVGRGGKQKPRLRRILERLDGNVNNRGDNMNVNTNNMVQIHLDRTTTTMNDCSFEI